MQQCAEVYVRCRNKYALQPIDPAHFMTLFKVSLAHEWIRLADKDTKERAALAEFASPPQIDHNLGELSIAFSKASWELRYVIEVIAEAPQEFLEVMFAFASIKDMNARILKMCGLHKSRKNVLRELKNLCTRE
jgi:hypothetical protein